MSRTTLLFGAIIAAGTVSVEASYLSAEQQAWVDTIVGCIVNSEYGRVLHLSDSIMNTASADPVFPMLKLSAVGARDMDYETVIDSSLFERAYADAVARLDSTEAAVGMSSYSLTLRGSILATVAAYDLRQRKYVRAVRTGLTALDFLEQAMDLDSSNADASYFLGLYDWSRADLRRRMWWVLFWLPGDRERGVQRLEHCRREASFSSTAAELSLVDVYTQSGKYEQAHELMVGLSKRFPGSRFVLWGVARHWEAREMPLKAAEAYERLACSYDSTKFGEYNAAACRLQQASLLRKAGNTSDAESAGMRIIERCGVSEDKRVADICKDASRLLRRMRNRGSDRS